MAGVNGWIDDLVARCDDATERMNILSLRIRDQVLRDPENDGNLHWHFAAHAHDVIQIVDGFLASGKHFAQEARNAIPGDYAAFLQHYESATNALNVANQLLGAIQGITGIHLFQNPRAF